MKAIVFEGRESLRVADLPVPECGEDQVLLRIAACGICGSDVRSFFSGDPFTEKSRIPGHEAVGIAAEVGKGVAGFRKGERLALAADLRCGRCFYCRRGLFNMCDDLRIIGKHVDGGLADCLLLTREILEHGIVNRVPDALSTLHAALSEPLSSVLASHDELAIQAGETVVVLGCGPMGILHLELLRTRGALVTAVDTLATRVAVARREFGHERSIDSSREDVVSRVRGWTEGAGADVAIVAAPSPEAVRQAISLVRKRGRVGVFGGLPGDRAEVAIDMNRVHYAEIRIVGNFSYHPSYHERALHTLASGAIPCERLIACYPLEDARRGLEDIRLGRVLKAVVVPNGGDYL